MSFQAFSGVALIDMQCSTLVGSDNENITVGIKFSEGNLHQLFATQEVDSYSYESLAVAVVEESESENGEIIYQDTTHNSVQLVTEEEEEQTNYFLGKLQRLDQNGDVIWESHTLYCNIEETNRYLVWE